MKNGMIVYTASSLFTPLEEATLQFGTVAEIQQAVTEALMRRLAIPSQITTGNAIGAETQDLNSLTTGSPRVILATTGFNYSR